MAVIKKLKIELPYDPGIPHLSIYLKELKSVFQSGICTLMFIATLFTVAKKAKQLKCKSMDERIKKICCVYAMRYYSAVREKEILTFVTT